MISSADSPLTVASRAACEPRGGPHTARGGPHTARHTRRLSRVSISDLLGLRPGDTRREAITVRRARISDELGNELPAFP